MRHSECLLSAKSPSSGFLRALPLTGCQRVSLPKYPNSSHTPAFVAAGMCAVKLTVTDDDGTATMGLVIVVGG